MKHRYFKCALLMSLLATGCAQYRYGDKTYTSREQATLAARNDTDASVSSVTVASERLGGRTLLVIPTRVVIEAHGVHRSPAADAEGVEYVADVLEMGFLGVAESVRKGRVFDEVTVLRYMNPENALFDTYDFKLWLFSGGPSSWQWYLSRKGVSQREPVSMDAGLQKSEQLNSFNKAVVRAGERLGAKPIPAAATMQLR